MKIEPISEQEHMGNVAPAQNDTSRPKITPQVLAALEDSLSGTGAGDSSDLARLPKRISGGLKALEEDIERRADEYFSVTRMLHQQRLSLEIIEHERNALYEKLGRCLPELQETGRALKSSLDARKSGDVPPEVCSLFQKNARVLEELEDLASSLNGNLSWLKATWNQYARTIVKAQRHREESRHPA